MMSRPDSLNEMIHWITEDVTNDTAIALYAFEEEREQQQQQQQHQEASKKNNNNTSNHKTSLSFSSCSFKLEQKYTRFEMQLAVLFTSQNIHQTLVKRKRKAQNEESIERRKERCAIFMDSSSKYFVVTILALFLLEIEFTCVETSEEVRALVFDERWNPCTFAVAFERDRTFLEETMEMLTSEDDAKKVGGGEFVILTEKSAALREPLDDARMMSSSKGCHVGARDAFVRKAMEDLNLFSSSSAKNNNNNAAATTYVCFTSGTTGRPKGVKTTRENIEAYARAKVKNEKLDASSIVALVSAHVFDPCIGDIASAIVGKSAIATFSSRAALMRGGNALRNALVASRATHVCCTPSFWEFGGMLDDDDDDNGLLLPKHLKFVSLGGEKMSKSIKDSFRESGITLLNVYGVTEATVYQTSKKISTSSSEEEVMRYKGATNIGTPLDESFASLVIVDRRNEDNDDEYDDQEVAEDNTVGEIAIYGRGVPPEGYLESNAPPRGRNAFRDIQFRAGIKSANNDDDVKRRRCYMTGDLGYFDSKTNEYYLLGRIESDRQVKIRGHRIELEGVESLLRERCEKCALMPNVIERSILCFVDENISTSSNSSSSDNNENDAAKEIVAFIKLIGENDDNADEEENRRARRMDVLLAIDLNCCAPWLSLSGNNAAMVPRKFVFLEKDEDASIPLSATGKRDFRAFYERHRSKERVAVKLACSPYSERDETAKKKDELETLVAKCWADALSCGVNFENIKKNDSFVRLGGNSMSALIACRKVREAMRKRRSFLGENDDENDDENGYENEEEKEPGVKKSEAGALLAPENIDNNDEEQENSTVRRLCGAFQGIDGEGPLAPCELLRRPALASYCAFLRANFVGLNSKLASKSSLASSSAKEKREEEEEDKREEEKDKEIHPDVLAAKAAVYRACARGTDVSLVCALVAPFVNDAELLRAILGNAAALSTTNEKRGKDGDENLTALHVLTSRANINEDYLSEEKVLPLVELLVCEYKADALAQTRSGKTTPIHIAAARGCPKILKILYQSLDSFVAEDDAGTNEEKKKKRLFFMKDADEQTCLHLASRSGNREAVRAVLDILFDGDDDQFSRFSASVVHATDAWNRTGQDWAFLLGFHDALEVFSTFSLSASSSSSRELGENERDVLLPLLPVERDLISLPSKSSSSSEPSSSNTRKMDVSSEYLETLFTHLKKKNDKNTIENRLRAASGLRDSLCANARNRQLAFERNVATVLIETLVSLVSEEPTNKRMEEETLLLHVIFCIRNAAGYGPARKQFLTELDALPALASVVNGRRKEKHPREEVEGRESEEDNISWQALSAMIVLCRAKETKEGLLASMEMLKELGYEDVCGPIFERTNMKILKTAALSAAAAKRETR